MRKILGSVIGLSLPVFHWVRPHSILEWIGLISLSHELEQWGKAVMAFSHLLDYWPFVLGLGLIIWANWDAIKAKSLKGWKLMNQRLGKRKLRELSEEQNQGFVGIAFHNVQDGHIEGNRVSGFDTAVEVTDSRNVSVKKNTVTKEHGK